MISSVLDQFDLSGRVSIVTGAGHGIGEAIARALASAGARVMVTDRDPASAAAVAESICETRGSATYAGLDVTSRLAVDRVVDDVVANENGLDIFVNNAGVISDGSPMTVTEDELDAVHAVNFKGLVFGSQAAARVMTRQGSGSIVNITTAGIDGPSAGVTAYTTAKAAAHQYTRSLALEIGPRGVRVNAVAPGWIETPMTKRRLDASPDNNNAESELEHFRAEHAKISPLGMVGEPIDVAYAVLYLASDAAKFVTGSVMRPNGGMTMLW